jgi:hypothetical protein
MKRRTLFVAGLMVAALVVASGVAWAASISCPNRTGNLCVGTDNKDTMTGRDGRTDEMTNSIRTLGFSCCGPE